MLKTGLFGPECADVAMAPLDLSNHEALPRGFHDGFRQLG